MKIDRSPDAADPTTVILSLWGALDLSALPDVSSALDRAVEEAPRRIVIDLAEVDSIDAAGVGMLATARSQGASADIEVMFVGGSPDLVARLQRAGLLEPSR